MADESQKVGQDEIEQLLAQAKAGPAKPAPPTSAPAAGAGAMVGQDEIEALLAQSGKGKAPAPVSAASPKSATATVATPEQAKPTDQGDIDTLLKQGGGGGSNAKGGSGAGSGGSMAQQDIELLLTQAEQALASIDAPVTGEPPGLARFQLHDFSGAAPSEESATLELIRDVELDVRIEFGRTHMYLEDVLRLRKGSVVALDKLAGDPVDIFVNERLIARGEVLVLNDNFCVRVAELIAGEHAAAG